METPTYPALILRVQEALGRGDESAIRLAVAQCLTSLEIRTYPVLAGGVYMMAGHFFLQRKQYADARTLYRQGHQIYADAPVNAVPEAGWLQVQALLCEAQTYYRAGKHPQALAVWQATHRFAATLPDPSPLSVETAIRLAEAYRRDGQRRKAADYYEEALTLAETLPQPLCPKPLVRVLHNDYLVLLDTTPNRRRLQVRITALLVDPQVVV